MLSGASANVEKLAGEPLVLADLGYDGDWSADPLVVALGNHTEVRDGPLYLLLGGAGVLLGTTGMVAAGGD